VNKVDIDIKGTTREMEAGDGCALLFNKVFQDLNKNPQAQMDIVRQVKTESENGPASKLSFEFLDQQTRDKNGRVLDIGGVNIHHQDRKVPIFQEITYADQQSKKIVAVQKQCHFPEKSTP
jgi:hypothetical protein